MYISKLLLKIFNIRNLMKIEIEINISNLSTKACFSIDYKVK